MFRTILLAAYIIPAVYVFFRLRKYFSDKKYRKYFSILYIVFTFTFPCIEFLSHSSSLPWITNFTKIGYYSLPYLLYLFLTVLLVDIVLAINYQVKIIPISIIKNQAFKKTIFAIILTAPLLIVITGALWHGNIRINSYQINIPQKSSDLNHLRIAFAADLHLKGITDKGTMDMFVFKINSLNPDLVLLGGDIIEGDRQDAEMTVLEQRLRKINSTYGVFAAFGNHELHGGISKLNFYSNSAIKILQDSFIQIDKSFYLAGRNDSRSNTRKTIVELLNGMQNDLPIILLDHRPSDFGNVSRTKVDVQVSGHTHNGQLFPINYITSNIYELSWGHKKIKNTHFFVTSGLQSWGPAVKTAGTSEIMVIDIDFIKK
jgi:predicted MPP superfamily phosphohydrolase